MRNLAALFLLALVSIALVPSAFAQPRIGLGAQLGEPSGVGVTWQDAGPADAVDVLLAWDLGDDTFFTNAHVLYDYPLSTNANTGGALRLTYGPGAFLTFDESDDLKVGLSGTFGLAYALEVFDIYLRVTPRVAVLPGTSGDVGGGLGLRYFF